MAMRAAEGIKMKTSGLSRLLRASARFVAGGLLLAMTQQAALAGQLSRAEIQNDEHNLGREAVLATQWQPVQSSQVRLIAGRRGADGQEIVAGLQMMLQDGWKTYWRNPGDAGGVPPELDWTGSENVESATLLYPAPRRFKDRSGETIGYEGSVVLPVLVKPVDPDRPVVLNPGINFGLCGDICIPVQQKLTLEVPREAAPGLPVALSQALESIPRHGKDIRPGDPKLVHHEVKLNGDQPRIVLDVDFGQEPEAGDVFAEASDGIYLPMPQPKAGESRTTRRFEIDLLAANDPAELKGKTLRVTMVGAGGASEASLYID